MPRRGSRSRLPPQSISKHETQQAPYDNQYNYNTSEQQNYDQGTHQDRYPDVEDCGTEIDPLFASLGHEIWPQNDGVANAMDFETSVSFRPFLTQADGVDALPAKIEANGKHERCKVCMSYVNPFCVGYGQWSRWQCALCGTHNEILPNSDFAQRLQHQEPFELSSGSWESLMQDTARLVSLGIEEYVDLLHGTIFAICASQRSVESGMFDTVVEGLKEQLKIWHEQDRDENICFLTYNERIQFYEFNDGEFTQVFEVSDTYDPFVPVPHTKIMLNVRTHAKEIQNFLDTISTLIQPENQELSTYNCFGAVLSMFESFQEKPSTIRLVAFNYNAPNLGLGEMEDTKRDDKASFMSKVSGSLTDVLNPKEKPTDIVLKTDWYVGKSPAMQRKGIAVDLFQFSDGACELTSIGPISSQGRLYLYSTWRENIHATKFLNELQYLLELPTWTLGFYRVRASKGIILSSGMSKVKHSSAIRRVLNSTHSTISFNIKIKNEQPVQNHYLQFASLMKLKNSPQLAKLTVHTIRISTSDRPSAISNSLNITNRCASIARTAAQIAFNSPLIDSKQYIQDRIVSTLTEWAFANNVSRLYDPHALGEMYDIALYGLGALKSAYLDPEAHKSQPDKTFQELMLIASSSDEILDLYFRPLLYDVAEMLHNEQLGTYDEEDQLILPQVLPLTKASIRNDSVLLLDDGMHLILYFTEFTQLEIVQELFQLDHLLDQPKYNPLIGDEFSFAARFENLLHHCKSQFPQLEQTLVCVKEGTFHERIFTSKLFEDLTAAVMGITEFVRFLDKHLVDSRKETA